GGRGGAGVELVAVRGQDQPVLGVRVVREEDQAHGREVTGSVRWGDRGSRRRTFATRGGIIPGARGRAPRREPSHHAAMLHHRAYTRGDEHDWVVCGHGAGGSSSIWYRQIRDFREHFNVLLIDLRGHGGSPKSPSAAPYTFREVSQEVLDVLDHLEIASAHFVG